MWCRQLILLHALLMVVFLFAYKTSTSTPIAFSNGGARQPCPELAICPHTTTHRTTPWDSSPFAEPLNNTTLFSDARLKSGEYLSCLFCSTESRVSFVQHNNPGLEACTVNVTRWIELDGSGLDDCSFWFPTREVGKGVRHRFERGSNGLNQTCGVYKSSEEVVHHEETPWP